MKPTKSTLKRIDLTNENEDGNEFSQEKCGETGAARETDSETMNEHKLIMRQGKWKKEDLKTHDDESQQFENNTATSHAKLMDSHCGKAMKN